MVNCLVARELAGNFAIEAGYIGRFGRDLLIRRDLAMPLNLVDTKSGMDYFTAAQQLIRATQAAGISGQSPALALTAGSPNIPYWENLFPAAAGGGLTATQAWRGAFNLQRARLHHRAVRHGRVLLAGVQHLRSVRLLRGSVRLARGDQLDRPVELQRDDPDAAQAVQPRLPVRRELHAVEIEGPGIERRARQRVRHLRRRRLLRVPDQLLRSGARTTASRTSTCGTRST